MAKRTRSRMQQKWTPEEEGSLRAGVNKHGIGKWKQILRDPEFASLFVDRSNVDLKDKWRNLCCRNASLFFNAHGRNSSTAADPNPSASSDLELADVVNGGDGDARDDTSSKSSQDRKKGNYFRYKVGILEAIRYMNDPNGSDFVSIAQFIEGRYQPNEIPKKFRRILSDKLTTYVSNGIIEKVGNSYKIKGESCSNTGSGVSAEDPSAAGVSAEDASADAARLVVEAENAESRVAKMEKEFERIMALSEEANSMLEVAECIHERTSRGEVIVVQD